MNDLIAALIGIGLAALGALSIWFRVPVAAFFRAAQERRGSPSAFTQTPALVLVIGAFFFIGGVAISVAASTGWLRLR